MQPTIAGFTAFIRQVMAISTTVLPDNSPVIPMALAVAMAIVNPALKQVALPSTDGAGVALNGGGLSIYVLATYNLAGSQLLSYAQDLPGAAIVPGSINPTSAPNGLPFFAYARAQWNINGFVSGVIQSSGDEGTNQSFIVQEAAKNFTLQNLQQLKDPYGRQYLAFAQSFGPTTFGLT